MGAFADFADLVHGRNAEWGRSRVCCHPNCGVGTAVMVDQGNAAKCVQCRIVLNIPGLLKACRSITDAAREVDVKHDDGDVALG